MRPIHPGMCVVRFTGLAGIYPREIFAGNYTLTTVTVEIFMYAAYPVFYRSPSVNAGWPSGFSFLACHLVSIVLLRFVTPFWVFNSVFMLGIFWYAGALAAHLVDHRAGRVSGLWLLLAWIIFLVLKATPHFTGLNLAETGRLGSGLRARNSLVLRIEQTWRSTRAIARSRVLRRLGDLSYSLYAMHTPAIMLATWALLPAFDYFVQLYRAASLSPPSVCHGLTSFYRRDPLDRAPIPGSNGVIDYRSAVDANPTKPTPGYRRPHFLRSDPRRQRDSRTTDLAR